jgi:hypothetical protein
MASTPAPRWPGAELSAFALATFNLSCLLLVALVSAYANDALGGTLSQLGTGTGLAAFGLLWVCTWRCVRHPIVKRSLIARIDLRDALGDGLVWGGVEGWVVLGALLVLSDVALVAGGGVAAIPAALTLLGVGATFGGIVAFAIGGTVGVLVGAIDAALLALSFAGGRGTHD